MKHKDRKSFRKWAQVSNILRAKPTHKQITHVRIGAPNLIQQIVLK